MKGSVNSEGVPGAITEKFQVFSDKKSRNLFSVPYFILPSYCVLMNEIMEDQTRGKLEFLNR